MEEEQNEKKRRQERLTQTNPGPGNYNPKTNWNSTAYSIREKTKMSGDKTQIPGPCTY